MKIINVDENLVLFDNGNKITFDHNQDCCEENYADCNQIEKQAFNEEFDENLIFEPVEGSGFRFGNKDKMFFIPCYSEQNGYYTTDLDLYYNGNKVATTGCKDLFY